MATDAKWANVPRCKSDFCGGAMVLERALLRCLACSDTRPATADEARKAMLAWTEVTHHVVDA